MDETPARPSVILSLAAFHWYMEKLPRSLMSNSERYYCRLFK
jgi:hypothetical protein